MSLCHNKDFVLILKQLTAEQRSAAAISDLLPLWQPCKESADKKERAIYYTLVTKNSQAQHTHNYNLIILSENH